MRREPQVGVGGPTHGRPPPVPPSARCRLLSVLSLARARALRNTAVWEVKKRECLISVLAHARDKGDKSRARKAWRGCGGQREPRFIGISPSPKKASDKTRLAGQKGLSDKTTAHGRPPAAPRVRRVCGPPPFLPFLQKVRDKSGLPSSGEATTGADRESVRGAIPAR
jgi:hypothetical protein